MLGHKQTRLETVIASKMMLIQQYNSVRIQVQKIRNTEVQLICILNLINVWFKGNESELLLYTGKKGPWWRFTFVTAFVIMLFWWIVCLIFLLLIHDRECNEKIKESFPITNHISIIAVNYQWKSHVVNVSLIICQVCEGAFNSTGCQQGLCILLL